MKLLFLVMQTMLFFSASLSETQKPNSMSFSWIKELHRELFHFRQYDKNARPISNESEQIIKVDMQFSFVRVVFNEKDGTLETNGWLGLAYFKSGKNPKAGSRYLWSRYLFENHHIRWVDNMMKWDPLAYGDLNKLKLMSDMLWKPDIVVFNSLRNYDPMPPSQAILLHDGVVYYIPPLYFVTPCDDLDINKWPEGFQKCEIRFGAWTLDSNEVLLGVLDNETKADLKHNINGNLQWRIIDAFVITNSYFNCCSPNQEVIVTVKLQRQSSVAEKTAIISSVGIWIFVLLTYWINPQSTNRITIGYSGSFGMTLILIYFVWKLPTGKNIPIVVITHATLLLLCGSTCVINMINRRMLKKFNKSVPRWINLLKQNRILSFLLPTRASLPDDELNQVCLNVVVGHNNSNIPSSFSPIPMTDQTTSQQLWKHNSTADDWKKIVYLSDRLVFIIFTIFSFPVIVYTGFICMANN